MEKRPHNTGASQCRHMHDVTYACLLAKGHDGQHSYSHEWDGYELREMAQALADVRTLDDWAERNAGWWHTDTYLTPGLKAWTCMLESPKRAAMYSAIGATPDEARAKAAAWVREQAKVAQHECRSGMPGKCPNPNCVRR